MLGITGINAMGLGRFPVSLKLDLSVKEALAYRDILASSTDPDYSFPYLLCAKIFGMPNFKQGFVNCTGGAYYDKSENIIQCNCSSDWV
jgi:hypothetical protein